MQSGRFMRWKGSYPAKKRMNMDHMGCEEKIVEPSPKLARNTCYQRIMHYSIHTVVQDSFEYPISVRKLLKLNSHIKITQPNENPVPLMINWVIDIELIDPMSAPNQKDIIDEVNIVKVFN